MQQFAAPQQFAAASTVLSSAPRTVISAPTITTGAPVTYASSPYISASNVSSRVIASPTYVAPAAAVETVVIDQGGNVVQDTVQYVENQEVVVEPAQDMQQEVPQGAVNSAFVFVKPHAYNEMTINTVRDVLINCGINVVNEGDLTADVIADQQLIDRHYYSIASKATMLKPDQLAVPSDKFEEAFGVPWENAIGSAYNAMDAMEVLQSNVDEIGQLWAQAKDNKKLVKLGGGFYCGLLEKDGFPPIYVFNAFFMGMRQEYVAPGACIHWYAVEWDEQAIPWADFRGQVLGPTDPSTAPESSIRGLIFANWQELGLAGEPNTGTNGVHASASPLEAMYERCNWLGIQYDQDPFGSYLLECQIPLEFLEHFGQDPQVILPVEGPNGELVPGGEGSCWDHLEDSDTSACVDKIINLVNANMQQ
jgi:nucleoside diphosphate kinase